jgi:hypothetical protein
MAFQWTIGHAQNDVTYKGGRVGKNKIYRDIDSYDYRMIETVATKILDCPIFTGVGFATQHKGHIYLLRLWRHVNSNRRYGSSSSTPACRRRLACGMPTVVAGCRASRNGRMKMNGSLELSAGSMMQKKRGRPAY